MFMRAAVMMHTVCLQRQETFDGSFPHNCLTGPVNEEMRSFFNVVFRGRSALCAATVSWLLATPILIREIRLHATYHNCSSSMLLRVIELELLMIRCVRPCEKETSHYMYTHATNSAASSTPWTIRSSLHNKNPEIHA